MLESTDPAGRVLEGTVINGFNSRLTKKIDSFQQTRSGVRSTPPEPSGVDNRLMRTPLQVATYQWDSYSFFTKILDDPKKYGFPDSTSYGSNKDFWVNNYHPSCTKPSFFSFAHGFSTDGENSGRTAPAQVLCAEDIAKNVLKSTIW